MKHFKRSINLLELLDKKSFFLFGARGTGKSFLIRNTLGSEVVSINLLRAQFQMRLLKNPSELEEMIDAQNESPKLVVIDEIQKIPILLDEVHRLIEERNLTFLLTGSSARKLKAQGVNLLAGRAWIAHLYPLTYAEIPDFNLDRYLRYGGLPAVWLSELPTEELDAYVQTYINEEIKAEGLIRKIPAFTEFLRVAALSNGQLINYANLAQDTGVSPPTVASYYEILEDTLIGFQVPPWRKPTSRKAIASAKFYFFDTGVANTLAGTNSIDRNSNLFGILFEHWIALELRAYLSYHRLRHKLFFWRTESKEEVDFIVEDHFAIEVKASKRISDNDLKSIKCLKDEKLLKRYLVVSHDPIDRVHDGLELMHWKSFIQKLWNNELLDVDKE